MAEASGSETVRAAESLRAGLVAWIAGVVESAGARGVVFGLSGGVDSAVVCGLSAEAVGAERCLALILPIESQEADAELAERVASRFGVSAVRVELGEPFQALLETLTRHRERTERLSGSVADPDGTGPAGSATTPSALARANLKPRLRMIALYYYSNLLNYLVLGTGNRDEREVGYFTKWGDGAADAFPLGDLLKGEVRALARELDVPAEVIERPPSAGLWSGQTDEAELGFSYDMLDRYLLTGTTGDARVDARIRSRQERARHKLEPPPIASPS